MRNRIEKTHTFVRARRIALLTITMQLEILSRETIKPSSPTPPHLKFHALSLFDQLAPHMFVPLVFFFHHDNNRPAIDVSESLKLSLSKTLSRYYPFAGRIKDKAWVECNDEGGVTFVEARLRSVRLLEVVEKRRSEIVEVLFGDGLQWKESKWGALLVVQITLFECGGFAIGVLLSHKLADMATMVKFVYDWAFISRDAPLGEQLVNPLFVSADLFPLGDLPAMSGAVIEEGKDFLCNRIVFEGSKIEALKNSISDKVENPTRVEVVSALIYKALISASRSDPNHKGHRPTLMLQTLNLRTRVAPPLPENLVGSLVSFFPVAAAAESEVELHELVGKMRDEMGNFCNKYANKYRTEEWGEAIKGRLKESGEILSKNGGSQLVVYRFSSGCRFPIYGVDFGWGAAAWVTMPASRLKNTVMMLDAKNGGGIEALVGLDEDQMAAFLQNQELLSFASLNPSANNE